MRQKRWKHAFIRPTSKKYLLKLVWPGSVTWVCKHDQLFSILPIKHSRSHMPNLAGNTPPSGGISDLSESIRYPFSPNARLVLVLSGRENGRSCFLHSLTLVLKIGPIHNYGCSYIMLMLCCYFKLPISGGGASTLDSNTVVSNSLRPHGLQNARLPCPSPTPEACSNSYPLSQWCHPTISSSVVPFSSCLRSFLASGSFPMSQFFTSGGQTIEASASASVFPMNIQDWIPLGLTGLISL